jgi:alpha-tubulin suppressor-like RCC1 family protein
MDCGLLRVMNTTEFDFSCEVCTVWATGKNDFGQLGYGTNSNLPGFTNVSSLCADFAISKWFTSILKVNKTVFWSGKRDSFNLSLLS